MRVEVHPSYPTVNFVIHAENRTEVALLMNFTSGAYSAPTKGRLFLHSYGGNTGEGVYSFCFGWRPERDFKPRRWWHRLWRR